MPDNIELPDAKEEVSMDRRDHHLENRSNQEALKESEAMAKNHWVLNSGKCGVCGDPYQNPAPRDNESGGKYGKGIVTRTYAQGQKVTVNVLVTANHDGWFEFKLCPDGSPSTPVTQACLDKYVLPLADGSGTQYQLGSQERSVSVDVMLPPGVTCTQCVLQWRWRAGNNFGRDPDGTTCRGCGPQEEFYGCSDIAITSGNGGGGQQPPVTMAPPITTPKPIQTTLRPQTTAAPIITFAPITFPQYTNAVQTYGTNYPTFRPINFPLFTRPTTPTSTTAPPTFTNPPITTPSPSLTSQINGGGGRVTLPNGFIPISLNPGAVTNPTLAPIRTNAPFITQTPRPTFNPQITTSRLQLITSPKPNPTRPNIFQPQTTQRRPFVPVRPFTLFPPFMPNSNSPKSTYQPPNAPPTFYRPPTTPRPLFTIRPIITTPFYRPKTTPRPVIITNPQTPRPTTFYRPPTTQKPTTKAAPITTQPPPVNRCYAINSWKGVGELEYYCQVQCTSASGVCPLAFCECQP